jgi:hypothetical protein
MDAVHSQPGTCESTTRVAGGAFTSGIRAVLLEVLTA